MDKSIREQLSDCITRNNYNVDILYSIQTSTTGEVVELDDISNALFGLYLNMKENADKIELLYMKLCN